MTQFTVLSSLAPPLQPFIPIPSLCSHTVH